MEKIYKHHNTDGGYDSFPEKYFKENSEERGQVNDLCKEYPDILKLADMCHTVANFMPCPERFHSVKGLLGDECLKTMLDKINKRADLILKRYNEEHKSNS